MKTVTVIFDHAIGDPVEIVHAGDIEGRVCAHVNNVEGKQYRVRWWQDGRLHDEALYALEIRAAKQH